MYLPSTVSCANYYICQAGQLKHQTCDEGFYFSMECNCCDKRENVQCLIEGLRAPAENLKRRGLSNDLPKLNQNPTLIGETNQVKCPTKGHFLYQYIEDPVKYFTCVEGKATLYACPNEFKFDDKLKRCVPKETSQSVNVKWLTGNNDDELSGTQFDVHCPMKGRTTLSHFQKNKYYLCIEGEVSVFACATGLVYDDSVKSCTTYNTTETNKEIDSPHVNPDANILICPKLGTFIFPHVQKNRYYICIDGNAIRFACAQGHVFDTITNTCKTEEYQTVNNDYQKPQVLDESVDILCPPFGAMKFAHKQKHKFYLCVNGIGSILACAEGSFFEPQSGVCRRTFDLMAAASTTTEHKLNELSPINQASSTECPMAGIFIYGHTDENLYSVCLDGNPIIFSCPKGLIFDKNKKTCGVAIQAESFIGHTAIFENEDEDVEHTANIVDFETTDADTIYNDE